MAVLCASQTICSLILPFIQKYQNFVYKKSTPYFLAGAEKEDIVQEAFTRYIAEIKSGKLFSQEVISFV